MPYNLPTFPLVCNIWRAAPMPPTGSPTLSNIACQLRPVRKTTYTINTTGAFRGPMELLLPKGTDIRGSAAGNNPDVVEVPASSGRFYFVLMVDDVAKGFQNEHRFAYLEQPFGSTPGSWPYPTP